MSAAPHDARLVLVGGGARSGKSRFGLRRARELAGAAAPVALIATAQALDGEMAERIRLHRAERDPAIATVEEPLALGDALRRVATASPAAGPRAVVVDCLTLWLSNLLVGGAGAGALEGAFADLDAALERRTAHVVLITNEVGLGLVPETALGRLFRDAAGRLHQRLAARADETYAALMGLVLRLRPAPVEAIPPHAGGG